MKDINDITYNEIKERKKKYLCEKNIDTSNLIILGNILFSINEFSDAYLWYSLAAEYSTVESELYFSTCMMALCFLKIGRRKSYVNLLAEYAISISPNSPEAYGILLDNLMELYDPISMKNKKIYSKIGLKNIKNTSTDFGTDFLLKYREYKFFKTAFELNS